ncbi:MAG: bifunctional (p)ppGpp synthetase/guanosine-3',5'-bis(diphosphate) 3'-pyrophosphohydrolase [Lachnospiraceae bacterium]|nr:bifunctional (p)ppGpp synthetase/guanosine-3',5'-bis(diphosphate) 3'-pyrophosphohydrolase [Sarcina sp.]MBQ6590311.1 bifunctional (p)ppGpp synthetase/guanosine-3',5'-bis(diphosphate) 3'-pyrophosphohydrolase [Lachnospiraceae bacterium]
MADSREMRKKYGRISIDNGKIACIGDYDSPQDLYKELIERVRKYHPSDDIRLIEKAYDVALGAHEGQLRKSGEPYIIHPLCVSIILAELEMDKETIAAGLLHDVVEDTVLTREEIEDRFGSDVALLVDGVTKLKKLKLSGDYQDKSQVQQEMQARNLRKMFLAMARDIRVILIKLADRLHNMRTLEFMPPEKQQRISQETVDIYAPIADRLGISKIKVELDDLALKYLYPDVYYELVEKVTQKMNEREHYVQEIAQEIKTHIREAGIDGEVDGRVKHLFSIYRKMVNQKKSLEEIYDLFAVRVIVNSIRDCYAVLGTIHEMYKPIPGRFKDYIAMPKANMYQSLHTTLIGPAGQPFEIQIRTYDMHRAAEYGIAAHWKYKEAGSSEKVEKTREEEKLTWLRQILEWQQDMSDNREFMDILKSDLNLFSDDVYCFTPRGEVKNLPAGSTPVDFAYAIHTAVGNRMVGARVNDKIVNIDYEIKNGDRIEIITSSNSKGPSLDWLTFARSASTRNKINQWFKKENKEENIIRGRELIYAYAKAHGLHMHELIKPVYQEYILRKYGFRDWESLLAAVGHGGMKEGQIVNKLADLYAEDHKHQLTSEEIIQQVQNSPQHIHRGTGTGSVVVKGAEGLAIRFSKCCNPVPGDEIVGFITRGRGISIHRKDCSNVNNLPDIEQDRLIEASWIEGAEGAKEEGFLVEIKIYARDRSGLLNDLTKVFSEKDISILRISSTTGRQGIATLTLGFEVKSRQELHDITTRLQAVRDVQAIKRTSG